MKTKLLCTALLCALACGPTTDPEPDDVRAAGADIKNCPKTNPDYPNCDAPPTEPPGSCKGLSGTLSFYPSTIVYGQSATLSWNVNAPPNCAGQLTVSSQPVGVQGSMTITPLSTTPYQLRLDNTTLAVATITVQLPGTIHIKGNTPAWRRLLLQALATRNQRVVLDDTVDMDMTGFEAIPVAQGVTLTSEAPLLATPIIVAGAINKLPPVFTGPPSRAGQNPGPRIYTTSRPQPLFILRCNGADLSSDNARFIGFRLQGPHYDTMEGDDNLERGIMIDSCVGVEIANMEISGWSGQGVYIVDTAMRQFNPEQIKIHDSFFHHNQHVGGNGYGVVTSDGAYAAIERNLFDFNRHAIASAGAPGTGYRADLNLVLKGGGVHDKWYNEYTHLFDVHGDANCPDIPLNQHTWNCGNAGDQYWMTNNAFQYTNDNAIKLRGVPRVAANIYGNVFAHDDLGDAVNLYSSTRVSMGPNTVDVDTYGQYGVCDFDGDGRDDLFLATGASWWYSSGGRMDWRFLSNYTERLHQVGLGDFDGDKRCDVFALEGDHWAISSGGRGAWTPLPGTFSIPFSELRFGDFNGDGITDIFRRAPDGQWYAISPGRWGWTALQSSGFPLSELRFGDFNGDKVTDVLSRSGGSWSVSWSGTSAWSKLPSNLNEELPGLFIADVDGIPGDDILRYKVVSPVTGRWEISSGGATAWQTFATLTWPSNQSTQAPAYTIRAFVGRFDAWANADLLAIDSTRTSRLFSAGHSNFAAYGLYAY